MFRAKSRQIFSYIWFVVCSGGAVTQGGLIPPGGADREAAGNPTVQFFTDYDQWVQAVGSQNVRTIDFETLPDGSPTHLRGAITPDFNYTAQGVTFLSPRPRLGFVGNPDVGFALEATSYPSFDRNWIIAEFTTPVHAVSAFFTGGTFTTFGVDGDPMGSATWGGVGNPFVGAVSTAPIGAATLDNGGYNIVADDLLFVPVPEPMTATMLLLGAIAALGRRKTRRAIRAVNNERSDPCI